MTDVDFKTNPDKLYKKNYIKRLALFSRRHIEMFFSYFTEEIGFDIPCKLSVLGKNKKKKNHKFVVC